MTIAGLLLMAASILKFQEMLTICVPSWPDNKYGFWESYEFLLIQIPLEFALGVWMVSGLFRKAAWIAGTLAYLGFVFVTVFKVITGAESCGCFGQIHVNPWITLLAVDIPFFLLLAIFRPKGLKLLPPPWPHVFYLLAVAAPTIGLMVLSTPVLVSFRPNCLKPQQVQPDESAKKALQEYLRKQQGPKAKPQEQTPEAPAQIEQGSEQPQEKTDDLTIGRLKIEPAGQTELYTVQVDGKQNFLINASDPQKIVIVPLDPDHQKISVLSKGIEIDWISDGMLAPRASGDPNVTATPVAALVRGSSGRADAMPSQRSGGEVVRDMAMQMAAAGSSDSAGQQAVPEPTSPEPSPESTPDPNVQSAMNTSAGYAVRETSGGSQAASDLNASSDPNTPSDPNVPNGNSGGQASGEWEWLKYVVEEDVRAKIAEGLTVIMMYHYDCPICAEVVPQYSDYCKQMAEQGNEAFKIALLAIPPYSDNGPVPQDTLCIKGKLTDQQDWQVMSPYVIALLDGKPVKAWKQGTAPEPDKIIDELFAGT